MFGGGLLGFEAAAALLMAGARVTVVHALGWPMERQLDPEAGALPARQLGAARRLRFVMPARTEALEGEARVTALRFGGGTRIACDLMVMAVGIRPSVALAREAGLDVRRGIVVADVMHSSDARILAIGECAEHRGVICGLVAPALAMAATAAAMLAGD